MKHTLKCSTCNAPVEFDTQQDAEAQARDHMRTQGSGHVLTCTRPAHGNPGGVPVIVFIANPDKRPPITIYTATIEAYRLPPDRRRA